LDGTLFKEPDMNNRKPKSNAAESIEVKPEAEGKPEDEAKAFAVEELELPEIREQANAMSCD
jgi:hypothetical protein